MVDGVLYGTGQNNRAFAIDMRTGRAIGRYQRNWPDKLQPCCGMVNRGFAILGTKLSGALQALDPQTVATNPFRYACRVQRNFRRNPLQKREKKWEFRYSTAGTSYSLVQRFIPQPSLAWWTIAYVLQQHSTQLLKIGVFPIGGRLTLWRSAVWAPRAPYLLSCPSQSDREAKYDLDDPSGY